eukprot:178862-Prorocentrum_lima.AAC.1
MANKKAEERWRDEKGVWRGVLPDADEVPLSALETPVKARRARPLKDLAAVGMAWLEAGASHSPLAVAEKLSGKVGPKKASKLLSHCLTRRQKACIAAGQ